ncbi:MAG: DUF885 domain-containing protein [Caulobacterales bacterium]|nr:DUF885 domain-containing protein [Caulobacterales bacterium]
MALAAPARAATDYAEALAKAWGAPLDPHTAHAAAAAAVRAAQARADRLLKRIGLAQGSVGSRLRTLSADPRWLYPDDDAGRDRAVAEMNARLAALRPALGAAFGDLPIAEAQVRRMSPAEVAAGRAGYREAPQAGRAGAYYVDLRAIRERPAWTLPGVAFHEVIPGHLLQLPLQAAADVSPERAKAAGAYFEAWAIYAEQLAADLGAYRDDPRGEIGYLQWRLFRLGRAVADTGLGALGWTPAQAIAAMTELQGRSIAFITIEADVARMAERPGQVTADALGALEIARLRPKDRALWPAFHRKVLAQGPWPPADLAKVIAG